MTAEARTRDRRSLHAGWSDFGARHTLIAQFVTFYAFSIAVTVLQYLMLTFLPGVLYRSTDWWQIPAQLIHLSLGPVDTYVFDYPVTGDETGGMGYFAAFAITLFVAQCVNFPMQRNITFKSTGNIWYQMAWYILAFVLITVVCSFLMGLYVPFLKEHLAPAVYNVAITVVNGGVQMVIYFPVYKIIFPSSPVTSSEATERTA
ncbi:hypothetical protein [Cellulomonas endometrii]|uniref:hypothetical protein n=1 Tax=Cellulomonas endometrii TaxID=3036301 RepID=UPI0024AE70BF|nr:hypothetical protein [Cellulomonas endometrii]